MTTQTVTSAVAQQRDSSPAALVRKYRTDFATVLPSHIKPETWLRIATGALRRSPQLANAAEKNPTSLLVALLDAARKGLEPGTEQYYLVPRKTKRGPEVLGITGYQGEVELMYRAGAVSSVKVEVVREHDTFAYNPGEHDRPVHEINWRANRGDLVLAYAYAKMRDGATSNVSVLSAEDIAVILSKAEGADSPFSPWQWNPKAMWLKSAAHQLAKWVPTSAERVWQPDGPPPETPPAAPVTLPTAEDVVDAEVVEDWPTAPADTADGER
ncbi:recombinase RecT [Amycolatopsis sp. YIM 10]|uniref:recombinase RecT n=1 Tax=Amycolatopsis sp. YIM 10 TaxID=2653857 RepID=UPI0012900C40|nr:recombinase RecT [Amycolatopsis sp. YIM 10]QFU94641.1 recombination and repair protein RecT [Amycolatopsis sp. YIM 10]